jgi:hypothetical protein
MMVLARGAQIRRKKAGDSVHEMLTRAKVPCHCAQCVKAAVAEAMQSDLAGESEAQPVPVAEEEPF